MRMGSLHLWTGQQCRGRLMICCRDLLFAGCDADVRGFLKRGFFPRVVSSAAARTSRLGLVCLGVGAVA